jgi:hypothetical protein
VKVACTVLEREFGGCKTAIRLYLLKNYTISYNLFAIGTVRIMNSLSYKNELNQNGNINPTFIKPLKKIFYSNKRISNYLIRVCKVIKNDFVSLNKDNVQYT